MNFFLNFEPDHCSMSGSNHCFLTWIQIFQEAHQVIWYSHLFKNFPQFSVIQIVKVFSIVNEAEIFFFFWNSLGFLWSNGCWQFGLWFLCLSESRLNIWKFMVHVLLKSGLKSFEHYFATVWDMYNCVVVSIFFGIAFLGIGMKTDIFQSCGLCWVFEIRRHIEWSIFIASSFSQLINQKSQIVNWQIGIWEWISTMSGW